MDIEITIEFIKEKIYLTISFFIAIFSALFQVIILPYRKPRDGKSVVPLTEELAPIYEIPIISLAEKELVIFNNVIEQHLNEQGGLVFESRLPLNENYEISHDLPDFPAWHGHWIAALAMKMAVEPDNDVEFLLHKSVEGLRACFEATGIPGLLTRSYLKYDGDEPLPWMKLEEQRPTRFWQKGENGFWFRNGVSKDQYCGAVFGLATIIGLESRASIKIKPETSKLAYQTLLEIAHYLINNKYKIIDVTGNVTEFGGLGGFSYNGFNTLQVLAMLRPCIEDEKCASEYKRIQKYGKIIAVTLGGLGNFYARVGRENVFAHFSDDQATYSNALALFLNSDDADKKLLQYINFTLQKMWQFLRYSRKSYMTFIHAVLSEITEDEKAQAIETLKMFPDSKRKFSRLEREKTHNVQPIPNQYISSHYWKSDYFKKATRTDSSVRTTIEYSGHDYLSTYWIGRYFGLISDEE